MGTNPLLCASVHAQHHKSPSETVNPKSVYAHVLPTMAILPAHTSLRLSMLTSATDCVYLLAMHHIVLACLVATVLEHVKLSVQTIRHIQNLNRHIEFVQTGVGNCLLSTTPIISLKSAERNLIALPTIMVETILRCVYNRVQIHLGDIRMPIREYAQISAQLHLWAITQHPNEYVQQCVPQYRISTLTQSTMSALILVLEDYLQTLLLEVVCLYALQPISRMRENV